MTAQEELDELSDKLSKNHTRLNSALKPLLAGVGDNNMGNDVCFLVTILYESESSILTCAIRISRDRISEAAYEYPQDEKKEIWELLPPHVRSCGPVINVEPLFELVDLTR